MSSRTRPLAATVARALAIAACAALAAALPAALGAPEEPEKRLIVVEAARVITVSGEEFAPGQVVIEDGKVTLVGSGLDVPKSARRIDARGETVMPGLVLARTRAGLGGYPRTGIHADARALAELHADELDGEPLLRAGFVAAAYAPDGIGFSGQSAVVRPPREGAIEILRESAYLTAALLENGRDRGVIAQAFDRAKKEIEKAEKARADWQKKQEEAQKKAPAEGGGAPKAPAEGETEGAGSGPPPESGADEPPKPAEPPPEKAPEKPAEPEKKEFEPPKIPPELVPLVAILRKEEGALPLLFQIGAAGNLLHLDQALERIEEARIEKHRNFHFVPSSTREQRAMVAALGERGATVLIAPLLVERPDTIIEQNLAAELDRAGAKLVFLPVSDSDIELARLRARTADLVRSGLPRASALRALTENPAAFLGIGDRTGSIEKGRSADLVFLDGDPFASATRVTRTMIAGEWAWREGEEE